MRYRYLILLFLLTIFLSINTRGQGINRKKLDSLFDILSKRNLAMGSIAISQNGTIVYQKTIGNAMMNEQDTIPANEKTEYRIGSISKMYTAVIIFQLIEEHKLSFDDTLAKFFPGLPNAQRITIGYMLRHRSGLPNFTNNNNTHFDDWKNMPKTHDELLAMITAQNPDFEPNAKADYNNSNYLLLSYIIEKICKKPYKNLLNERIINKIGLKNTYYGSTGSTYSGNECASYKYFDSKWVKDSKPAYLDNFSGAGAIISTPPDMLKFINALFTYQLVNKQSLDMMETMIDGYGMGMFPYGDKDHPGFGHNGKTEGFASSLSYYPGDKLAIAYCTNSEVYSKNYILDGVRNICFGRSYAIPTFAPIVLDDPELEKYTGNYKSGGLAVICTKNGGNLWAETHGQKLKLDAIGQNKFMNTQFGFFFDFNKDGKQLIIIDVEDEYALEKQ